LYGNIHFYKQISFVSSSLLQENKKDIFFLPKTREGRRGDQNVIPEIVWILKCLLCSCTGADTDLTRIQWLCFSFTFILHYSYFLDFL